MHSTKPAEPVVVPASRPLPTEPESVTTEFRSVTLAEIQNQEEARETARLEQERMAALGPVAGMD